MKHLRSIFIGCLCLLLAGCGRQKEAGSEPGGQKYVPPAFQFAAHAGSSVVRLMWLPPSWPKDADGLVVKRRVASSKEWEQRCAPISPGLRADRRWEGHAFSQERGNDLREQVQHAARTKPLPANPASFIAMLWKQGVGISVHPPFDDQDYDTALLAGLAWEDGEFDREKIYEYGVFWSIAGTIAKAPAAVRRVKYCDGIDGFKLAAEPGNGEALKLVWKFDREKADYFRLGHLSGKC